jgi:hypothetical protein
MARAAINDIRGLETPLRLSLETFGSTALRLTGLSIVSALGIVAGAIVFVLPAVFLSIWWSVCGPALVIEGRGVIDSLKRSTELTDGYRWRVFGYLVAYYVLSWIAVEALYALVRGVDNWAVQRWVYVIGAVVQAVKVRPIAAGAAIAIYSELRTIKEGDEPDAMAAAFD